MAFRVGFETEFVLLRTPLFTSDLDNLAREAVDRSLYCQSSALQESAPGVSWRTMRGLITTARHLGQTDMLMLPRDLMATSRIMHGYSSCQCGCKCQGGVWLVAEWQVVAGMQHYSQ